MSGLWAVLAAGSIPAILGFVANYVINRRTLAVTKPKTDAEVIDLGISTQNRIMTTLEARITRVEATNAELSTRLEEAESQNKILRREAATANRRVKLLSEHIEKTADWITVYAANHPPPSEPPPSMRHFED